MKKFFEKLKSDVKFKQAGSGKSLESTSTTVNSGKRHIPKQQKRRAPSYDSHKAGEAALARVEAKPNTEVNWAQQAIKARVKKEMEAEKKMAEINLQKSELENTYCENPDLLAVDGVYFHCPFIGDEVNTYEVIKENIKELLYVQLQEDPSVVSCLIIHSCNKSKQKITDCIQTLCKCVDNIIDNPTEEKFRRIRLSTKTYQDRIAPVEGAKEFLQAAGFILQILPHNDSKDTFWVFPEEKLSDLQTLEALRDALISAEPLKPKLDRDVRVLFPQQAKECKALPRDFFNLTVDEFKKEMQTRKDDVERSEMLMTKVMRDKLEAKEMKKYKFTLIRIRFPNQIILQGTFGVYEKVPALREFIQTFIVDGERNFNLLFGGIGILNLEDNQTLCDLRLVPNVMLNFEWRLSGDATAVIDEDYLNEEAMQLLQ